MVVFGHNIEAMEELSEEEATKVGLRSDSLADIGLWLRNPPGAEAEKDSESEQQRSENEKETGVEPGGDSREVRTVHRTAAVDDCQDSADGEPKATGKAQRADKECSGLLVITELLQQANVGYEEEAGGRVRILGGAAVLLPPFNSGECLRCPNPILHSRLIRLLRLEEP